MSLYVKNVGTSTFSDRFDGVEYVCAPRKNVELPQAAAEHIFGYGRKDKTANLIRLGWLKSSTDMDEAMAKLDCFKFTEVAPALPPEDDEPPEPRPEPGRFKKNEQARAVTGA